MCHLRLRERVERRKRRLSMGMLEPLYLLARFFEKRLDYP